LQGKEAHRPLPNVKSSKIELCMAHPAQTAEAGKAFQRTKYLKKPGKG
jgi:hypothetical protein